ncbi:cytochrome P450 [Thermogemmatispora onikobensis]|uniref:cytochrome P450 n=1 Tax=Thermogemmatispora onikobensis TaxID=732234 RepID=UPI000A05F1AA|nr:cytochrome P450 [Thermogemmatispora onikobensis]
MVQAHAPETPIQHRQPATPNLREILALLSRRNLPITFLRLARKYGDVVHVKGGPLEIFLLSHPEDIREVLVVQHANFHKGQGVRMTSRMLGQGLLTSEGDFHKRQRKLIQPAFHRQRIASYATTMVEEAARLARSWQDGTVVDMAEEMMRLTLVIAGKTLFNVDVEREASTVSQAMAVAMEAFIKIGLSPWAEQLELLPLPIRRRFYRARDEMDRVIYRIIEEHRRSGRDQGDLLSWLLEVHDEEGAMSDEQLRDEMTTLLLAGHETTANALAWTWYLLAQHPEVAARLRQEVVQVLGDRLPTADDFPRLTYAEWVLAESMRLYPPAWGIDRTAMRDCDIRGVTIPTGARVIMSQYVVHRDPRFYPEPERFFPERWTPEARAARPKFAYFPFGGGPRLCVGEPFAWMEGVLVLATLIRSWEAELVPGQRIEPEAAVTLRPRYGIRMRLHQHQRSAVTV